MHAFRFVLQIRAGSYANIYKASTRNGNNDQILAIKEIWENFSSEARNEISCLRLLSCEHVIQLHGFQNYLDRTFVFLELLEGGSLIDRIIEKRNYNECDARIVCRNLLNGVAYCHEKRIAIRNIKLEALLLVCFLSDTSCELKAF